MNLLVVAVATPLLRQGGIADGRDRTRDHDYVADEGDPMIKRMTELLDGALPPAPTHQVPPREITVAVPGAHRAGSWSVNQSRDGAEVYEAPEWQPHGRHERVGRGH